MDFKEFNSDEFKHFVQDHLHEDPALLLFKYQGKVAFVLKLAVQQIAARQKAAKKLPEWSKNLDLIFPPSLSLEQSSSEQTAKFKAKGLSGKCMVDLTGGFGVDSYYLSQGFEKAVYCEQQAELVRLARYNLNLLQADRFEFVEGDGLEFLRKTEHPVDLIYADPARRGANNQKFFKLKDGEPDLVKVWSLLQQKTQRILLKVSPMIDLTQAWMELPDIQKIQIVSVKNEVKEVLLHWEKDKAEKSRTIEAVDLESTHPNFEFTPSEESEARSHGEEVQKFLVEPTTGILKAGAFNLFGQRFGLKKLEKNSHLYTSELFEAGIPGRVFEVLQEISPKKQEIRALFPSGKVNVICRNYVTDAEELKKRFSLKDGGEGYLIGTKTRSGPKLFFCKRRQ